VEQQQTNDNGQGAAAGAQPLFSGSRNKLHDYDLEERRGAGERAQEALSPDRAPGLHCQRVTEAPLASASRSRATAARHDPSRAAPGQSGRTLGLVPVADMSRPAPSMLTTKAWSVSS
jgi:hypothetical protein